MGTRLGTELGTILGTVLGTDLGGGGGGPPPGDIIQVVILGIGESGMTGYGGIDDDAGAVMPAGYPPASGLQNIDDAWNWHDPIAEPCEQMAGAVPATIMNGLRDGVFPQGQGSWGPLFSWELSKALGSGYKVTYVPCGLAGSQRTLWAPAAWNISGSSPLWASIQNTVEALRQVPGSIIGAILLDQGINDANNDNATGWATDWAAIETLLRASLFGTQAPLIVRRMPSLGMNNADLAEKTQLRSEQASFASGSVPKRIIVDSPEGPFSDDSGAQAHLATSAQYVQAQDALTASLTDVQAAIAAGRPGNPAAPGTIIGWTNIRTSGSTPTLATRTKKVEDGGGPNLSNSAPRAIYMLLTCNVAFTGTASIAGRGTTGAPGSGWLLQGVAASGGSLRFRVVDGSNTARTKDHAIVAGDISDVMAIVLWHDGTQIGIRVNKAASGSPTACAGFSPAAGTVPFKLDGATTVDYTIWGIGSCELPTTTQMDEWADACKAANLCVEMPGVANDHLNQFWPESEANVRDEIGIDYLMASFTNRTRVVNAAPVWGF